MSFLARRSHLPAAGEREEPMDPRRKARWPKAMPQAPMPLPPRAADQSHARLDSGRRGRGTDTGAVLALAALRLSKAIRSSFSKRSTTTQVSAPCAPPPCSVRLMNLISTLGGRIRERLVCRPITTLPSIMPAPRWPQRFEARGCRSRRNVPDAIDGQKCRLGIMSMCAEYRAFPPTI